MYSFQHVKQEVSKLFDLFNFDRCKVHNRISQSMMSFAYSYGGPGHTAVTRGEVVYLAVPVIPDLSNTGCCKELPVTYNNASMYMSPRDKVLLDVGTPIECLPDLLPKFFFIDNAWYIKTAHGLVETPSPHTMAPDSLKYSFRELTGLTSDGLYSTEIIKKYQNALISPMMETVISNRVAGSVKGDVTLSDGYRFSNGFPVIDYQNIKEKVGRWWKSFSAGAKDQGSWFAYIMMWFLGARLFIYTISCVLNFRELRKDVCLCLAIPVCLFECVCNLIFHDRIFQGIRKKNKEIDEPELEQLNSKQVQTGMQSSPLSTTSV